VPFGDRASTQRKDPGQRDVRRVQSRDLREHPLRTANHTTGVDVVLRAVPRAHQAPVLVDPPVRQIGEQVPAPSAHGEQLALPVPDRVRAGPHDLPGGQLRRRPDLDLTAHGFLPRRSRRSPAHYPPGRRSALTELEWAAYPSATVNELSHRALSVNGISMHVAEEGTGPPVVLCHGFPELWFSWRHQLPALAEAGYRAVAPDQRGYGGTDRPENVEAYDMVHLT